MRAGYMAGRKRGCILAAVFFVCAVFVGEFCLKASSAKICLKQFLLFPAFSSVRLRHFLPAVQLCFLQRLAQEVAEQLDNGWESWQLPFFEAYVPPSDSQLLRFLVSTRFKS